ncbi:unnamed protein product [Leuciscus chuanchicus]
MNSFVISDLELCGLEDTKFIDLPKVFTHSNIPVHVENIPKRSDIQKWPYLNEVRLPEIEADVGLLIGANCSRAMEPWHVINAEDGGPYAVKTAIGWVVNGPRIDSLLRKFKKNPEFFQEYKSFMETIIEKGYAVQVPVHQLNRDDNRQKLRVVFDCTASFQVHRASEVKDLDLRHDALPVERTLGVQWDTETDTFTYSMKLQDKPMTRRGILSVVNSIYDPLGFLAPVILPAKLLPKDLCKEQYGWDENIGGKHAEVWKRWIEDVSHLSTFHVSRCLKPTDFGCTTAAQLHHFSDASESAYGTVSYLLLENSEGEKHCAFLMGKARVAPLKLVTIPRLELTAAVAAVKIDKMLHQELQVPLQQSIFWTDSTTVLRYIDSETARFKTFVANRISLIREATKPSQWKYVRTTENPADQASRGLKAKSLTQGGTWINGPEFLLNNECDWSEQPVRRKESLQNDPEVKNGATINIIKVEENMEPIDKLISYYSDWHKLKRSVAWILKVKENLWKLKEERKEVSRKIRETEKDPEKARSKLEQQMKKFKATEKKSLTLDDLVVAESEIIKFSQRQQFGEEIKILEKVSGSTVFLLEPPAQAPDDADPGESPSAAATAHDGDDDEEETISLDSRRHEDPDAIQWENQPGNIVRINKRTPHPAKFQLR